MRALLYEQRIRILGTTIRWFFVPSKHLYYRAIYVAGRYCIIASFTTDRAFPYPGFHKLPVIIDVPVDHVVCALQAVQSEFDWVRCKYCPASIPGERIAAQKRARDRAHLIGERIYKLAQQHTGGQQ
jgi:hypothetical protein